MGGLAQVRVLIGAPAYKRGVIVKGVLNTMISTPASVVMVDNAAEPDVKEVLEKYHSAITVIGTGENTGCNGAWNQILSYGLRNQFDVIGLNSDAQLFSGWYDVLIRRLQGSTKEVILPNTGAASTLDHLYTVSGMPLFFLPREAAQIVYPIPQKLVHWFGETYIFVKLRELGWKTMVCGALRADHYGQQIATFTPGIEGVVASDKREWKALYPHIPFE
jgi:hypothetical protein